MGKIELVKIVCRTVVGLGIGTIVSDIGKQSFRGNTGIFKKITVGAAVIIGSMILSDKADKYINEGVDKLVTSVKEAAEEPVEELS